MIGKIVSALFVLFWLVVLPDLLRLIWEPLISVIKSISIFGDKNLQVIIILMVATNSLTLLLSNTLMYFIYISKIKYFESLKITKVTFHKILRMPGHGKKTHKIGELWLKDQYS